MAPHVACLLLREKILPFLATLHSTVAPDATVHEEGEVKPIAHLMELITHAMGSQPVHAYNWYLHGAPTEREVPRVRPRADNDEVTYQDVMAYVAQRSHAYTWCLLPWGVDYTGQMLLLLAADEATFRALLTELQGGRHRACADLVVSVYTADAFRRQRFRGTIFGRSTKLRGHGLLHAEDGASASALVLCTDDAEASRKHPAQAEVVYQTRVGSSLRTWFRVYEEAALRHYTTYCSADLVTAGNLDDRWMRESLGHLP